MIKHREISVFLNLASPPWETRWPQRFPFTTLLQVFTPLCAWRQTPCQSLLLCFLPVNHHPHKDFSPICYFSLYYPLAAMLFIPIFKGSDQTSVHSMGTCLTSVCSPQGVTKWTGVSMWTRHCWKCAKVLQHVKGLIQRSAASPGSLCSMSSLIQCIMCN